MSSYEAARCRHIKVSGTQCGSPALRNKRFCFFHQQDRQAKVECYSDLPEATGEISFPYFEDAHSVQMVIRQVVQMILQKRIERKTAGLILYALQIASSNLKRLDLEKPQPEQVVSNVEYEKYDTIAALEESIPQKDSETESTKTGSMSGEELPPGTIHACIPIAGTKFNARRIPSLWPSSLPRSAEVRYQINFQPPRNRRSRKLELRNLY
jgi:hypothetical protein